MEKSWFLCPPHRVVPSALALCCQRSPSIAGPEGLEGLTLISPPSSARSLSLVSPRERHSKDSPSCYREVCQLPLKIQSSGLRNDSVCSLFSGFRDPCGSLLISPFVVPGLPIDTYTCLNTSPGVGLSSLLNDSERERKGRL